MDDRTPVAPAAAEPIRRDRSAVLLDVGLVVGLGIGALLTARSERPVGDYAELALIVLPLLVRRTRPFASLALVAVAVVITSRSYEGVPVVQVAAVALASEAVGQYGRGRSLTAVLVLGVAAAMSLAFLLAGSDPLLSVALPFVVVVPSWILGDTIRMQRDEAKARVVAAELATREREERLRATVAQERREIARELHDIVAHSVSVMLIQAGAARQVIRTAPERAEESLLAVEATGREAMRELRGLLGVLGDDGDAADDAGGLGPQPGVDRIPVLIERVQAAGLAAELEVDGERRALPSSLDVTVYRIAQEALTNALRYASRARTIVHLTYEPSQVRLEVLDDGPGPPQTRGDGGGRGLEGMRQRASLVGGRLEAGPRLGGGYAVRAWLPVPPEVGAP